jgi:omega-6 fatty acid desaturase (delta-12 desaturase)
MLKGKDLILATKPFAKEFRGKSWRLTLSTLFLLILAFAGSWIAPWFMLRLAFSLLAGLLMVRMFIIYHDYLHHAILHKSKVAAPIMTAFGIFVLAPSSIWKRSHDYHHKHNSRLFSASIGSYPIATREKFLSMERKERFWYLFTRHPLTILFGYLFMFIIDMCLGSFLTNMRRHADSLLALLIHICGSVLIIWLAGWEHWMLSIFIPFFIACCIGSYLFYAQHNFPGVKFYVKEGWTYEYAALESSSFMRMNPLMRWFTGNIGYHHIHHLNSRIPFYRLPEIMAKLPELQSVRTTSLAIREIIACLRLKAWDTDAEEMVGFRKLYPKP